MLYRKSLYISFLLCIILTTFSCKEEQSLAPRILPPQSVEKFSIPDANFKLALVALVPKAFEGGKLLVSHKDIAKLETLDVSSKSISSLDGIQFLMALKNLNCSSNQLTSLDVSKNTALTELRCSGNQLTSLDVSQNKALTTLNCVDNKLASLDVSKNTALINLYCNNNQLTTLDLSTNTALKMLYAHNNQLRSLSVATAVRLEGLYVLNNPPLSTLDLSNNPALTMLDCSGNNALTTLDFRGMRSKMYGGALALAKNPNLTTLKVHVNLKDDPSIKDIKTERGTALTIETYNAEPNSITYHRDCANYNPNATTESKCVSP